MAGFDLFGLKKGSSPESPEAAPAPAKPLSAKAWKGLAAADAVVLLACLGLLAVRVRGHLSAPPLPPPKPPVVKKAEPKAPEAKPEAPKPEPAEAKKPEPKPEAKKPEPKPEAKKPEPKPEAKKPEPKPAPKEPEKKAPLGSPAIHAAPAPKRDPAPVGAPPPPSFAPKKAATRPVPFTYEEAGAKEVYLVGPFLVRSGGRKTMFKDSRGSWQTTVYLNIGQTYKYRFEVVGENGKKLTPSRSVEVLEAD